MAGDVQPQNCVIKAFGENTCQLTKAAKKLGGSSRSEELPTPAEIEEVA